MNSANSNKKKIFRYFFFLISMLTLSSLWYVLKTEKTFDFSYSIVKLSPMNKIVSKKLINSTTFQKSNVSVNEILSKRILNSTTSHKNQTNQLKKHLPKTSTVQVKEKEQIKPSFSNPLLSKLDRETRGHEKVHILLVCHWRGGSSFLSDILQYYPATFYTFEPFHLDAQTGNLITANKIKETISNIFTCNYNKLQNLLNWMKKYSWLMMWNKQYWNVCHSQRRCFDSYFISTVCRLSIINLIKTIRIELNETYDLLQNPPEGTNLKVVYLTRDPRGMYSSRLKAQPSHYENSKKGILELCNRMTSDFDASQLFQRHFPDNFLLVRYEDFSRNTYNITRNILSFAGLEMSGEIVYHLMDSVNGGFNDEKNIYSTRRNSSSVWYNWRNKLNYEQIQTVQESCGEVMKKFGYKILSDENDIKTFYPLEF